MTWVLMNTVVRRALFTSVRRLACHTETCYQIPVRKKQTFSIDFVTRWLRQSQIQTMSTQSPSDSVKPKIVFVLGAPGSGKGTQCANIVEKYNYVHLSAGDLLRAERNRPGSELAQIIEDHIRGGQIIPVAITCSLIERAMNDQMKVSHELFCCCCCC